MQKSAKIINVQLNKFLQMNIPHNKQPDQEKEYYTLEIPLMAER